MNEIRSYRRVFDLERRIYSIERLRLNPAGVPVRGVVYLLITVAGGLLLARLPLLGASVRALPWFMRDLGLPAALAAALTVIRIDGRTFHHAARAAISFWLTPRRTVALLKRSSAGTRWRPPDLLFLPDDSEPRVRRFCYSGPGTVLVRVAHSGPSARRGRSTRARKVVQVWARRPAKQLTRARVIDVGDRTRLLVGFERR